MIIPNKEKKIDNIIIIIIVIIIKNNWMNNKKKSVMSDAIKTLNKILLTQCDEKWNEWTSFGIYICE